MEIEHIDRENFEAMLHDTNGMESPIERISLVVEAADTTVEETTH